MWWLLVWSEHFRLYPIYFSVKKWFHVGSGYCFWQRHKSCQMIMVTHKSWNRGCYVIKYESSFFHHFALHLTWYFLIVNDLLLKLAWWCKCLTKDQRHVQILKQQQSVHSCRFQNSFVPVQLWMEFRSHNHYLAGSVAQCTCRDLFSSTIAVMPVYLKRYTLGIFNCVLSTLELFCGC